MRIYQSRHEVRTDVLPFSTDPASELLRYLSYQPLAAKEIFKRAIAGKDMATGTLTPTAGYLTGGSPESTYQEGNSTIQFHVLPANSTYNYTGAPSEEMERRAELFRKEASGMLSHARKRFKPFKFDQGRYMSKKEREPFYISCMLA
jgi:hypothetical protein